MNILKHLVEVVVAFYVLCAVVNMLFGVAYVCVIVHRAKLHRRRMLTIHKLRALSNKCLLKYAYDPTSDEAYADRPDLFDY